MSLLEQQNNERIAKNTMFLYFRTLVIMAVGLYTSRIVLQVLGVEDFGIYNIVGGVVSMFALLSGSLNVASQRFLAFELGKEQPNIQKVFSSTVTIHVILAILIFSLLEILGVWFLNYKINIPPDRINAANWVFHCSVITFCISVISVPYNAAIIAYEKMSTFAYVSIFEALSKLAVVLALLKIKHDSLIMYATFMMLVALVLCFIYGIYCHIYFKECRYNFIIDKDLFYPLLKFSGWNFIGTSAGVLNTQGINILINLFFGVVLNAAKGIAMQVEYVFNTFVGNFMTALNPPIIKAYASQNYDYLNKMIFSGTKAAFFLFGVISLPIFVNAELILSIWLKNVPNYSVLFVRLGIIFTLSQNLSQCLYTAMLATGKIKKYQIIVGGLSIMAFPTAWIFFKIGLGAEWGYGAMIIFSVVCLVARLCLLQEMIPGFQAKDYVKKVLLPVFYTTIPIVSVAFAVHSTISDQNLIIFCVESIFYCLLSILLVYLIGLSTFEKKKLAEMIKKKKS